jgi:hypothetical protein
LFMSRIKLVVLSMLSVIVVSAVMVSSAAAVGPSCGSVEKPEEPVICTNNGVEKSEFEGLMGTSDEVTTKSILKSKLLGVTAEITCEKVLGIGIIEDSGKIKVKVTLLGCKLVKPAGCGKLLSEELKAEATGEVVAGTTKGEVKFTGANKEETFLEIPTEKCGTLPVRGKQTCETEKPDEETEEKTGVCLPSGSELKIGQEKAEMEVKVSGVEIIDKPGKIADSELEGLKWWFGKS